MEEGDAFDAGQLWVVPDGPNSLSEDSVKRFFGGCIPLDIVSFLAISMEHNRDLKTQSNDGPIGGSEGECTCDDGEGFYRESSLLDRTSRILVNDRVPRIRSGENFLRNRLYVEVFFLVRK